MLSNYLFNGMSNHVIIYVGNRVSLFNYDCIIWGMVSLESMLALVLSMLHSVLDMQVQPDRKKTDNVVYSKNMHTDSPQYIEVICRLWMKWTSTETHGISANVFDQFCSWIYSVYTSNFMAISCLI